MDFSLALQGLLIGLAVAAPVGPMSLLTMRRTLDRDFSADLSSGVGIACADASYGAIAAFSLTSLSDVLIDHQRLIRIAGGIALLLIGWRILRSARQPVVARPETEQKQGLGRISGTMYLLTLSNPNDDPLICRYFWWSRSLTGFQPSRFSALGGQRLSRFIVLVACTLRGPE